MEYAALGIGLLVIAIVLINTFRFKPQYHQENLKEWDIDQNRAYQSLSSLIQFKTVSHEDKQQVDEKEFEKLRHYIHERYPQLIENSTLSMFHGAMLFHIKGESDENPVILMSHYDVVPAMSGWINEPFSGMITDTHIYGRGALDTKHSLHAILEAVEIKLKNQGVFNHDLYLSFGSDEETYGDSQIMIVNYLKEKKITPSFVLDEGGAIVSDVFPGVKEKTAVIGIAEKGFLNVKLTARSRGGHASTPKKKTPLTELAGAVTKLNQHPSFKLKLTEPVRKMFNHLAPYSKSFIIRMLFANLWLFLPLVKWIAKKSGGEFLSLFRTTQTFTMMKGSDAMNVLPSEASIGINYRLLPTDTSDKVIARIKRIIKNPQIDVSITEVTEASTISKIDESYHIIEKAIKRTWPNVITAPYLMIATSDSRRYHAISSHVYKFSPMDVSSEDLQKIHGYDEDITKENVIYGVQFYLNLLDQI